LAVPKGWWLFSQAILSKALRRITGRRRQTAVPTYVWYLEIGTGRAKSFVAAVLNFYDPGEKGGVTRVFGPKSLERVFGH
jgi:hypothetical protein